jgi:DNA repair photolyase
MGNYLRIFRERFADLTEQQLGRRSYPTDDPSLTFVWPDILERLERQIRRKSPTGGAGKTLVFSMLTDGFSPTLVQDGTTEKVFRVLIERTSFRIRILAKNAVVASDKWLTFFAAHRNRVVVGLSTGTLDDAWAARIEVGTSTPSARLQALRRLQDAGVPTFGMLCPIFPDVLTNGGIDELVARIRPSRCEHVWAEPFNDRVNWRHVRDGYVKGSPGFEWFSATFERKERGAWSRYATDLYVALREIADRDGWTHKLRYLLYEAGIDAEHADAFDGLRGVLLQSPTDPEGRSKNLHIRAMSLSESVSHPAGGEPHIKPERSR